MSCTSVSMRLEPVSPRIAISSRGRSSSSSKPVPHRVVDVVVDVRHAVDEPNDLPLERLGLALARVREDAVAHLVREVERARDCKRLLVVAEASVESLVQRRVQRILARVAERRVAHVVAEPDRLGEILVEPQRPRDHPRDRRRLECVGHARAVVIAVRVDEHLRLALETPEGLRVDDAVAVALELRANAARLLGKLTATRVERADGEGRQPLVARPYRLVEAHAVSVEGRGAGSPLPRTAPRTRARARCSPRRPARRHRRPHRRSSHSGSRPFAPR